MNNDEKPMKKAKTSKKRKSPEIRRATIAINRHAWAARMMGLLPSLSDMVPQIMSPAAVLKLIMLWTTPRSTTRTPVERM